MKQKLTIQMMLISAVIEIVIGLMVSSTGIVSLFIYIRNKYDFMLNHQGRWLRQQSPFKTFDVSDIAEIV